MTDVRDPASRIEAAQKAVGDGDYLEAERLLREAAAIQEATLGESHPDVATTLNNLAFVCERTGKFDEAERGYRRAHRIAVASLSPGHPFIKTSLSNLMEFCEARGIPIWTRPETPVEDEPLPDELDVEPAADDVDVAPAAIEVPPDIIRETATASRLPLRTMAALALVAAAVVVMIFARQGQGTTSVAPSVPQSPTEVVPAATPEASNAAVTVPPRAPEPASEPAPEPVLAAKTAASKPAASKTAVEVGEERLPGLAMHSSRRRSAARHVQVLHTAADGGCDDGRASLVPAWPRASDDAAPRAGESGKRISHVQQ
jgi:hypothetical protein